MYNTWNLDPIYNGFDDPRFEEDLKKLGQLSGEFAALTGKLDQMEVLEGLRQSIAMQEQLNDLGSKLVEYAMLRQSVDS